MNEIKIRYTFKRKSDGHIWQEITPIECLEGRGDKPFVLKAYEPEWDLVKRERFANIFDKNKKEIYEGDRLFCEKCYSKMPSRGYISKKHPNHVSGYLLVKYKNGQFEFWIDKIIDEHKDIYEKHQQQYAYVHYHLWERESSQPHVEIVEW